MKVFLRLLAGLACLVPALALAPDAARAQEAGSYALLSGWYEGRALRYYDLGEQTPLASDDAVETAPVWMPVTGLDAEGEPLRVDGQHNIFDVRPGDQGYSDLWAVTLVSVPDGYQAETLRSRSDAEASGFPIETTEALRNCPIVPEGTAFEGGEPVVQGWVDGEEVVYVDFGPSSDAVGTVYVFVHDLADDGTPDPIEGQGAIFDSAPESDGYGAFRRVHYVIAPDGYEPNTLRTAADVVASGFPVRASTTVLNLPITQIAAAPGEEPLAAAPPGSYAGGGQAGGSKTLLGVVIGLVALGAAASAGAFVFSRRGG